MNRCIDGFKFFGVLKIGWYGEDILANRTVECERCVEHQRCLDGAIDVLIGIGNGDGAHSRSEASADAGNDKGYTDGKYQ